MAGDGLSWIANTLTTEASESAMTFPRWTGALLVVIALGFSSWAVGAEVTVSLTVDADKVVGHIDENIYGQFLEHIYHSCNGGLWGEIVWNRSFEESHAADWSVKGGCLQSPRRTAKESQLILGDGAWRDYELSAEVCKTGGKDAVVVGLRSNRDRYTLVLGGAGNSRHELQRSVNNRKTRKQEVEVLATVPGRLETGRWHRVRVRCEGRRLQAWLDDQPLMDVNDKAAVQAGPVALGVRNAAAEFRNVKVTAIDGRTLLDGVPSPARHWWCRSRPTVRSTAS
jgi:alpha-N-arabinofuranosidase